MKKISFVLFMSFVVLILGLCVNSYASECGDVLSDGTWKGVVGHHNGIYHAGSDPNPDDGLWTCGSLTDHGWSYQCVQYVNKFYNEAGMKKSIWSGNANQYYGNATTFGLSAYPNDGSVPPKPNDILCFDDGGYGHVAIITGVTLVEEDRYRIDLVEQNWAETGAVHIYMDRIMNSDNQTYTYSVESRGTNGVYNVQGWLRVPYTCQLYAQDPSHTITVHPGETHTFAVYYKNTMEPLAAPLLKSFGALDWNNDAPDRSYALTIGNQYRDNDSLNKFHYIELHSCNSEGDPTPSWLYPGDDIWISNDKVRVVEQHVPSIGHKQNAGFIFQGKIPETAQPGTYNIYFRPYHATGGYMEDWGNMRFTLEVVDSPGYSVGQGAPTDIVAMFVSAYSENDAVLGDPAGCVKEAMSGFGTSGYYQQFNNGSIQVHSGSSYVVSGKFYDEWGGQGYAKWTGFPISDAYVCSWGNCQDFEGGHIHDYGDVARFLSTTHPENLTAQVRADNSVLLSWENQISANGISVFRTASPTERIAVLEPDATSFVDDNAGMDVTYSYYVQAFNNTSESPASNPTIVKVGLNDETEQTVFFSGDGTVNDGFVFNHGFDSYATIQGAETGNEVSNPG